MDLFHSFYCINAHNIPNSFLKFDTSGVFEADDVLAQNFHAIHLLLWYGRGIKILAF